MSAEKKKSPFLSAELSPDRFEAVLKSISDGVFGVDPDWNLTCFNNAASKITGIEMENAIGKKCYKVLQTNICSQACALRYTMETGNPIVNLAIELKDSNNKVVPVSISTALLKDKNGKIIGGVETLRDLSVVEKLRKEVTKQYSFKDIVSKSSVMQQLFSILPTVSLSDSTILIQGESGTGKELLARAIHNLSDRKDKPFVVVNCSALPGSLIESELFGFKAGSFTGAQRDKLGKFDIANSGTVFLDEIGEIPLPFQVKLLRVIQERTFEPVGGLKPKKVDVRFISATNKSLLDEVRKGKFREDLFYRINVIRLDLPPLRERLSDIPILIDHFLSNFSALKGKEVSGVSSRALNALMNYNYPGNIRELQNILEYAFVLCPSSIISLKHLPPILQSSDIDSPVDFNSKITEYETKIIIEALEKNHWNRLEAAKELGIHKTTLFKKIRKLGITLPKLDGRSTRSKSKE